jgi:hypothetical protein
LGENDDGMKYTVNAIRNKIRTTKFEQSNSNNNEIQTTTFEQQRNSINDIRTRENSWKPKVVALLYEPKGKSDIEFFGSIGSTETKETDFFSFPKCSFLARV